MANRNKYMKNVLKSVTTSGFDALGDLLPSVKNDMKANTDFVKTNFKAVKDRLTNSEVTKDNYLKRNTRELINNVMKDIRTGELNNKRRENKARDKAIFGEAFDELDGLFNNEDSEFGGNVVNNFIDNSSDDIISQSLGTLNRTAGALVQSNNISFNTISKQISIMTKFHNENTISFYNSTMEGLSSINENLRNLTTMMEGYTAVTVASNYRSNKGNLFSDFIGGGLNIENMKDVLKKKSGGGSFGDYKNMFDMFIQPEIAAMVANPLGYLMKTGIKAAIPKKYKNSLKNIDELWQNIPFLMQGKARNWKDSDNFFKKAIGGFFDLGDKRQSSYKQYDYEKGAVRWDGKSRRALNQVIPGYLSKILSEISTLTGNVKNRDLIYDYESGKFTHRDNVIRNMKGKLDSSLSSDEITKFTNTVIDNARTKGGLSGDKNIRDFKKKTEEVLKKLIKSGKGIGSITSLNEISDDPFIAQYVSDTYRKLSSENRNKLNREHADLYTNYQDLIRRYMDDETIQSVYDYTTYGKGIKSRRDKKQTEAETRKRFEDMLGNKIKFNRSTQGDPVVEGYIKKVYDFFDEGSTNFEFDKNLRYKSSTNRSTNRNINRSNNRVTPNINRNMDNGENTSLLADIKSILLRQNESSTASVDGRGNSSEMLNSVDIIKTNTGSMLEKLDLMNANLANLFALNVNTTETLPPGTDSNNFIRNIMNKITNGNYKQAYQTILSKFAPLNAVKRSLGNSMKDIKERLHNKLGSSTKNRKEKEKSDFMEKLINKAKSILNKSSSGEEGSSNIFGSLGSMLGGAFGLSTDIFKNVGKSIFSGAKDLGKGGFNVAKGLLQTGGTIGKNIFNMFKDGSGSMKDSGFFSSIKNIFSNSKSSGKDAFKEGLGGLSSGAKNMKQGLGGALSSILAMLKGVENPFGGKNGKDKDTLNVYIKGGELDGIRNVVYVTEKISEMNSAKEQRSLFGNRGKAIYDENGNLVIAGQGGGQEKRKSLFELAEEEEEGGYGILDYLSMADDIGDIADRVKRRKGGKGGKKGGKASKKSGKRSSKSSRKGRRGRKGKGGIIAKAKDLISRGLNAVSSTKVGSKIFGTVGNTKLGGALLGKLGGALGGTAGVSAMASGLGGAGAAAAAKGAAKGGSKAAAGLMGAAGAGAAAKGAAKVGAKGLLKGGAKGVAKFIPFLGPLITAGFALGDGISGWNNAGQIFGTEQATTGQKVSSALGSAISGLTFGLIGEEGISKGIYGIGSKIGDTVKNIGSALFGIGGDDKKEGGKEGEKKGNFFTNMAKVLMPGAGLFSAGKALIGKVFGTDKSAKSGEEGTVATNADGTKKADSQRNEFNKAKSAKVGPGMGMMAGGGALLSRASSVNTPEEKIAEDSTATSQRAGSLDKTVIEQQEKLKINSAASMASRRQRENEREEDAIFKSKLDSAETDKGEEALDPTARAASYLKTLKEFFTEGTFMKNIAGDASTLFAFLSKISGMSNPNGEEGTGTGGSGGGSGASGTFGGNSRLQYAPKAAVRDALAILHESESGGDPGKVSNTPGDPGGQSFGSFQFSRDAGSYRNLLTAFQSGNYGDNAKSWGDRLMSVYNDNVASERVWKEIYTENPQEFQDAQERYWTEIYFERDFVNPLKKQTGFDVLSRSNGLIARAMSIANQFGPSMGKNGAGGIFANSVKKAGGNTASDKDILNNVQNYLMTNAGGWNWDSRIINGLHNRFKREHKQTLGMINDFSIAEGIKSQGASVGGGAAGDDVGAKALAIAMQQKGKPYVYGATGPNSFDCSGLMQYAYGKVGVKIDRVTTQQMKNGTYVDPSKPETFRVGDLLFPHSGHVVMYAGNNQTIEAPHTGDVVKVAPLRKMQYARRIAGGNTKSKTDMQKSVVLPKNQGDNSKGDSFIMKPDEIVSRIKSQRGKSSSTARRGGSSTSSTISNKELARIARENPQANTSINKVKNEETLRSNIENAEVVKQLVFLNEKTAESNTLTSKILEAIGNVISGMANLSLNGGNTQATQNAFTSLKEIGELLKGN